MAQRPPTGFDRYFDEKMEDPEFAAEYRRARREIDTIDSFIRALDSARQEAGFSKAELARQAGMKPEQVRRLLTARSVNPTFDTIVRIAGALDLELGLHPRQGRRVAARTSSARRKRE